MVKKNVKKNSFNKTQKVNFFLTNSKNQNCDQAPPEIFTKLRKIKL